MIRASFSHLLRAVSTGTTLFDKWNNLFTVKIFKTTCRLGGCRIPDALYLENLEGEIYNCALLLNSLAFFRYTTRIPLFSRVSSIDLLLYKYQCIGIAITYLFTHWLSCDLLMYLSTNSIIFLSFYLSSYVNSEKKKKKAEQFSNYSTQSECHVLQTSLCPIINICFPITSGELKTWRHNSAYFMDSIWAL